MKTVVMILLAGAFAMPMAPAAQAQTRPGFEIGGDVFDYDYTERYEGEEVARDEGRFTGLRAGYTKRWGGGMLLRARLAVAFGSVDYRSDDGETRLDDVSQSLGQLEIHLGRDFLLGRGMTLTPFAGIASRYLSDESGGLETENGLLGYDREVRYAYIPFGVSAGVPLARGTTLTISGQYNRLVGGDAESHLSAIDPEFPDIKVELTDGKGYEIAAMIGIPVGSRRLSLGPFVRGWRIDQSESFVLVDPEGSGESIELFEPVNRTKEVGLRISFAF